MKRKPDAMTAIIAIFFIGLVISGFSTVASSVNKETTVLPHSVEVSTTRY